MKLSTPVVICLVLSAANLNAQHPAPGQPVYRDVSYLQKFSVKYLLPERQNNITLQKVACDRNGVVQILSSAGLLRPSHGELLHPGRLLPDMSYPATSDKKISAINVYDRQLVYLDESAVFSNAWAGKIYLKHKMPAARLFCGGNDFSFLISDGNEWQYLDRSGGSWEGNSTVKITDILFDKSRNSFWLLAENSLSVFSVADHSLKNVFVKEGLTCFALSANDRDLIIGTHRGYLVVDAAGGKIKGDVHDKLPSGDISVIKIIDGKTWFGSSAGAFMLRSDGKFDYYASSRWLPSDDVVDIAKGERNDILVLTDKGLGEIRFQQMSLYEKAAFFEKQVRERHIRNGFNATITKMENGDPDTGVLEDSDNDGLWTSMYLGAEVFRYVVTHSADALQNCRESFDAMERLYTINPVKGFPARSFERKGYATHDLKVWKNAPDSNWDWKSTTSSDEAIGHIFVFGTIAELIDDKDLKTRAIRLIDTLMQHIVDHDMYLVDWNGEPTTWGRWNPEYVNARPAMVGDRKITSSNIIAMLQTAYHFTHKNIYRQKAYELLQKYGFLENLMRPMKDISRAPVDADELSRELSEGWNHSDDEMYFLGYWGLYRYALSDTLKSKFRRSIIDHWQAERPEKEAAWNIVTAMTGTKDFDLANAVDYLQRYPLDLVNWKIVNSQRKDIEFIAENFRKQTISEVLPPDELPIHRHNANLFELNGGDGGKSENSAGDIWLLPYWMGRYLGVIGAPENNR